MICENKIGNVRRRGKAQLVVTRGVNSVVRTLLNCFTRVYGTCEVVNVAFFGNEGAFTPSFTRPKFWTFQVFCKSDVSHISQYSWVESLFKSKYSFVFVCFYFLRSQKNFRWEEERRDKYAVKLKGSRVQTSSQFLKNYFFVYKTVPGQWGVGPVPNSHASQYGYSHTGIQRVGQRKHVLRLQRFKTSDPCCCIV